MAVLGVRIEFYEKSATWASRLRTCWARLPRPRIQGRRWPGVGELFSLTSLRVGPREHHVGVDFTGHGPFLPVRAVEHYPTPMDDEDNPGWNGNWSVGRWSTAGPTCGGHWPGSRR
ncbi:hypothetical protein GCM10017752_12690 [Streptomyces roseoviridis]